jgi:hypothetical protein
MAVSIRGHERVLTAEYAGGGRRQRRDSADARKCWRRIDERRRDLYTSRPFVFPGRGNSGGMIDEWS